MRLSNLKLVTLLALAFGLLTVMLAALGIYGLQSSRQLATNAKELYENWTVAIEDMSMADASAQASARNTWASLGARTPQERQLYLTRLTDKNTAFVKAIDHFRTTVTRDKERELVAAIDKE
jgi:hypothetical protein